MGWQDDSTSQGACNESDNRSFFLSTHNGNRGETVPGSFLCPPHLHYGMSAPVTLFIKEKKEDIHTCTRKERTFSD